MTPDPAQVEQITLPAPSREPVAELMHWLILRMTDNRTAYRAMLEPGLEYFTLRGRRAAMTSGSGLIGSGRATHHPYSSSEAGTAQCRYGKWPLA